MKERDVIIACDFPNWVEVCTFMRPFWEEEIYPFLKIGMELFYASPFSINLSHKHNIFLDLKLHDIPTTVGKAIKVLDELPVDLISIHGAGGELMLNAAKLESDKCAVVTQLTSSQYIDNDLFNEIMTSVYRIGLKTVICPAHMIRIVKSYGNIKTICPGIRLEEESIHDQVQVATPAQAKKYGADYIVVGRSITQAKDPVKVYKQICNEFL